MVSSLAELDDLLAELDLDQPYPRDAGRACAAGRVVPQPRVHLPDGWLDDPDSIDVPQGAELDAGGG